jgi:hypothetical protein
VLESQQEEDGGWQIQWEPPSEMARLEWRAHKTLKSLITLGSYNMIIREQHDQGYEQGTIARELLSGRSSFGLLR